MVHLRKKIIICWNHNHTVLTCKICASAVTVWRDQFWAYISVMIFILVVGHQLYYISLYILFLAASGSHIFISFLYMFWCSFCMKIPTANTNKWSVHVNRNNEGPAMAGKRVPENCLKVVAQLYIGCLENVRTKDRGGQWWRAVYIGDLAKRCARAYKYIHIQTDYRCASRPKD